MFISFFFHRFARHADYMANMLESRMGELHHSPSLLGSTELPFSLDGKKHGLIIQKTSDPTRKAAFFMTFGFNDDAGFDPGWPAHDPPSDRVANEPYPVRLIQFALSSSPYPVRLIRIRLTWAP